MLFILLLSPIVFTSVGASPYFDVHQPKGGIKMTEKRKLIATTVICATVATTAAAIGVGKKNGTPVHCDTYAIEELTEDGAVVKVTNTSDGPANGHVKDPDSRPIGINVPDGVTTALHIKDASYRPIGPMVPDGPTVFTP